MSDLKKGIEMKTYVLVVEDELGKVSEIYVEASNVVHAGSIARGEGYVVLESHSMNVVS